jgi:hypothetical protein
MKALFLVFGLLLFNLSSYADSSCWPEEELVGTTATGFIESVNFGVFQTNAITPGQDAKTAKKCEVKIYATSDEKVGSLVACDKIQCLKGDCGGEGEFTFLPTEDFKTPFALVRLKDRKTSWLKFNNPPEVKTILSPGKVGKLFPTTTPVLDSPMGKPLKINSAGQVAYTVKKLLRVHNEEWAEVELNPVLREEPPVKVGKSLGTGFFQSRDKENKVKAVLSDIWCD